jgi:hypothetical protein
MKDNQTSLRSLAPQTRATERSSAARARLPAALAAGSGIFLVTAMLFTGEFAGARGGNGFFPGISGPDAGSFVEAPSSSPIADRPVHVRRKHITVGVAGGGGGRAVCVRLCDGFFFPSVTSSGGDEACASQCPDAPTAFYREPAGSDRIEDAVSLQGAPYSALPVADRSQTSFDETCTCHRSFSRSYLADLLRDHTLRNGDVVMTTKGFTVFKSDKSGSISAANFVALSQSTNVPSNARTELTAMERAGIWDRQSGPYSYSAPDATAPSAATADAAVRPNATPRPRKGVVTVDDGDATSPK